MAAASQTIDGSQRIHEVPHIVNGILSTIDAPIPLSIQKSTIEAAGSGLFTTKDIEHGSRIFSSTSLVSVREPTLDHICDNCFVNSHASFNTDGRFVTGQEQLEMKRCTGCKQASYCSKVRIIEDKKT